MNKEWKRSQEKAFLDLLPKIHKTLDRVLGQSRLSRDEREEVQSRAMLKLIEDNYRVIRTYRGDAALGTFLSSVFRNLIRDYQIERWGRWRPSAMAKRHGAPALALEQLILRDGWSVDEAVELVLRNDRLGQTRARLRDLGLEASVRARSNPFDERGPEAADDGGVEDRLVHRHGLASGPAIRRTLRRALRKVSAEDRTLLRLRFAEGLSVAEIARRGRENQRSLYRRLERTLKQLRRDLTDSGLGRSELCQPRQDTDRWLRDLLVDPPAAGPPENPTSEVGPTAPCRKERRPMAPTKPEAGREPCPNNSSAGRTTDI